MQQQKFKNLDLLTLKYPFTAMISILHRLSGLLVYFFIPFLLCLLSTALRNNDSFAQLQINLSTPTNRFFIWLFLSAMGYHFFAGIRHLVMDMGWGENLRKARLSGAIMFILALLWAICMGVWLW